MKRWYYAKPCKIYQNSIERTIYAGRYGAEDENQKEVESEQREGWGLLGFGEAVEEPGIGDY